MSESMSLATLPDPTLVEEKSSLSLRFSRTTWMVIGACTLLVGLLAMGLTFALAPQYAVSRTLLVVAGGNPTDNTTIVTSFGAIMGDKGFSTELKSRSDLDIPVSQLQGMISVDSPPESAILKVTIQGPKLAQAEQISGQVAPTLRALVQANQSNLPIEQRIPGPLFQELYTTPITEKVYVPWYMGFIGGAVLGFAVSFLIAVIRQYRQPVVSSARDVGDALDL